MQVITLLGYGCPPSAIEAAYGFDRRTVNNWWERAGRQCETVHAQHVATAQLDLQQAQADEIKVRAWGCSFWMGLTMMVSTRLWLGGIVSAHRDRQMIDTLIATIRQVALCRPLLIAVDGLPHYLKAIGRAFRSPDRQGKRCRPRLVPWADVHIGRVIKRKIAGNLAIERVVRGCSQRVNRLITLSQGDVGVLNTAYIERLNATFRQRLTWMTRRSRILAHQATTLTSGMYVVGCFYNFCDSHKSLRIPLAVGRFGQRRWVQRTPALAAGLTDHIWSHQELLSLRIPPPRWQPPKQRGRRSRELQALIDRWC